MLEHTRTFDDGPPVDHTKASSVLPGSAPVFEEITTLPSPPAPRHLLAPQSGVYRGRLTVVLDMDETLIHSEFIDLAETELWKQKKTACDAFLEHIEPGKGVAVYVRPFLSDFLKEVGKHFEPVVFTAANKDYASAVLDVVDPDRCISHRLFRESTSECQGANFVKDVSRLGRDLARVVLVDNNLLSFIACPDNGLPILDFFTDRSDIELPAILGSLMELKEVRDVRPLLRRSYGLKARLLQHNPSFVFQHDMEDDERPSPLNAQEDDL